MIADEQVLEWVYAKASAIAKGEGGMGAMEKAVGLACREVQRQALERTVQRAATATPLACSRCGEGLNASSRGRVRHVTSFYGKIRFARSHGYCPLCQMYDYPADVLLGLQPRAPASPRVQEVCALTALRAPAGQAQDDVRRLTGIDLDPSTLHQEARRQGGRALALRDADVELARTPEGLLDLAARAAAPKAPFTRVIEIDAWNIRERDNWGRTERMRKAGEDTGRWHWVYTGTVFRLDQRGTTESGRPVIAERGYIATRAGLDRFRDQLYAEAIQRGLLEAQTVLILADGAIWIWNLADDRFKGARQRVDLHHVQEHLWDLARELFDPGSEKAKAWVAPYLSWLERRKDGALDVLHGLEGLRAATDPLDAAQREALEREIHYFETHQGRMDYKTGKASGQPVGSGAVESTCNQYQRRFKLPGQFWSLQGDEAFLALATLHRNGRWQQLFSHDAA